MAKHNGYWNIEGIPYDWPMTVEIDEDKVEILSITVPVEKEDGETVSLRFAPNEENEKLRELVADMYEAIEESDFNPIVETPSKRGGAYGEDPSWRVGISGRMRELGIEVEE